VSWGRARASESALKFTHDGFKALKFTQRRLQGQPQSNNMVIAEKINSTCEAWGQVFGARVTTVPWWFHETELRQTYSLLGGCVWGRAHDSEGRKGDKRGKIRLMVLEGGY
jgi:hypothetical protein